MSYSDPTQVCAPWIVPANLCCEGGGNTVDCDGTSVPLTYEWTDDELILAASNILFARTCYRFPGLCTDTITICLDCTCPNRIYDCGEWWTPIDLRIGWPVESIVSIELNGVPVPPGDFYLDDNRVIMLSEAVVLTGATDNQFVIVAEYGRTPPIELQMAAAELVCELKKACNSDSSCSLPPHVARVSRRDVDMEVFPSLALIQTDFTGNPIIDHALKVHGNCNKGSAFDPLANCNNNYRFG